MRCEEFDPKEYSLLLIEIQEGLIRPNEVVEMYLHKITCKEDKQRFDEYIGLKNRFTSEELDCIYEGERIVRDSLEGLIF